MIKLVEWLLKNWTWLVPLIMLLFLLGLLPAITSSLRNAKQGIKEAATPLGFFVLLLIIGFIVYLVFVFKGFLK